jgi:preprotein translocase subunit SecD
MVRGMNPIRITIAPWKKVSALLVCAIALWFALANVLPRSFVQHYEAFFPQSRINLGLDLQGGSHLLLQVDLDAYRTTQMEKLRSVVRTTLREQSIGYTSLRASQQAVTVTLRPETMKDTTFPALMRRAGDGLEVEELQENQWRVAYSERALAEKNKQLVMQTVEIIGRRIDELGTREPVIQPQGDGRILLQVAGVHDPKQLKTILGTTAKMGFHLVNNAAVGMGELPLDTVMMPSVEGDATYPLYAEEALSGDALVDAHVAVDTGQPVVAFRFDTAGAKLFGEITKRNIGKQFAVVLDGKVITAPVIRSAILGGSGIIEGNFTSESANNLALLLRAGALPTNVTIIEERTVGASLGEDSIAAGKVACMWACVLVMGFMLLNYRSFGMFANVALLANLVLLLASLAMVQATLTLPGIAGIVLTLGMAVDANVLIFERIREEARGGGPLHIAIEKGFEGAFVTILDSNITTLISALVLFIFGSGTIKGFAVTLSFGIIASMFSAIFLTRWMMAAWFNRRVRTGLPI